MWRARLDPSLDVLCDVLSRDERARAEAIVGVRTRRYWRRSRGFMRAVLALYLGLKPHELRFLLDESGKPRLANDATGSTGVRFHFSLSHSGDRALLALCRGHALGVDVELDRRELDEPTLAMRAFGAREGARLLALDSEERRGELLRAWTRREAVLKLGKPSSPDEPSPWVIDLDMGKVGSAALALSAVPDALRCWEWSLEENAMPALADL